MGPCVPDPCNVDGATGEVCVEGECNCPDAPCPDGELCVEGECMGMFYNPNIFHQTSKNTPLTNMEFIFHQR